MSKFYGTLQSSGNPKTLRGANGIKATAQSYAGSVSVALVPQTSGPKSESVMCVIKVCVGESTKDPPIEVYSGPISGLSWFLGGTQ